MHAFIVPSSGVAMSELFSGESADIPVEKWTDVIQLMEDRGQLGLKIQICESRQYEVDNI